MQRVLVPGEVGGQLDRPYLTVDGFKQLIKDLTATYGRKPSVIVLSEYDRRELNQQVMAASVEKVAKPDQAPEHDGKAIAYIEGVAFVSERGMSRGNCRPVFGAQHVEVSSKLGGEGKIIVGV